MHRRPCEGRHLVSFRVIRLRTSVFCVHLRNPSIYLIVFDWNLNCFQSKLTLICRKYSETACEWKLAEGHNWPLLALNGQTLFLVKGHLVHDCETSVTNIIMVFNDFLRFTNNSSIRI